MMASARRWLPLSSAQLGLWFAQERDPQAVLNGGQYVEIHGPLDLDIFETALNATVREAETLRATFCWATDGLCQTVGPEPARAVEVIDVGSEDDGMLTARSWMALDIARPVDMLHGPLFKFVVFRLEAERFFWYQRYHHLVLDGYGRWLITKRVADVYTLLQAGGQVDGSPFGTLEQLVGEDAAYVDSRAHEQDRRYWASESFGPTSVVGLATRAARGPGRTIRQTAYLDTSLKAALAELGRRNSGSLAQVITALVGAYAARMTGVEGVLVGFGIRSRTTRTAKRTPGVMSNILPLMLRVTNGSSVGDLVRQVARAIRAGVRHQRYRIEALRRDLGLSPEQNLFWSTVNYQAFDYNLRFAGMAVTIHSIPQPWTNDLSLIIHERSGDSPLEIDFDANSLTYDALELAGHGSRLARMVSAVARDPTLAVGELELLSNNERERVLVHASTGTRRYPETPVQGVFESLVDGASSPAVIVDEAELTYRDLNSRANQLARYLRALGVTRETRVALFFKRSCQLIIAALGVLKAGGAYVPLDTACPAARIANMLEDSSSLLILTQTPLVGSLPECTADCVLLDADASRLSDLRTDNLDSMNGPDDLAYLMYTSGSTGMPKGTAITHRAIVSLVCNTDYVGLDGTSRIAQVSNISFDASTFEWWGALLNGGTTVIASADRVASHQILAEVSKANDVDTLFVTTPLFNEIAREAPAVFGGLRQLLFGGETVDPRWVRKIRERHPDLCLLHVYGPTENTTFSTWYRVENVPAQARTVPIGRPIANARAYLLDPTLRLISFGMPGELYLGGAGLSRGYWNRPALTAERFVADPFAASGARMYRTGDVVRINADGDLEFLTRTDSQVKVRGFRVELGEIEVAMKALSGVRDAIAVMQEAGGSEKRVVGYVVADGGSSLDGQVLRRQLARTLPDYMVPSVILQLDSVPLTLNRKVDRLALPAPVVASVAAYRAPRTPEEEILCELFAEVLGVPRVGLDDDFFELGGHSLLATRLVSRVRATLGVELAIRTLFEAPSVGALGVRLPEAETGRPPLGRQERPVPLPVSYAQQRLWFIDRLEGSSTQYNMPAGFRLQGRLDRPALERALNAIVARHESLRTRFALVDGVPVQEIVPTLQLAVPVEDLRALAARVQRERVQAVLGEEWRTPFDLAEGPLVRLRLLQLGAEEHVLVRTVHHIVSDGWSQGVFNREFMVLYEAFRAGREDPLPPLAVQYADFALWQRRWLEAGALTAGLRYWREQLAGMPDRLALPTDRPRPVRQTFEAEVCQVVVSAAETAAIKQLGQTQQATLYMTLLAAFGVLLARHTGQDDIVVGSPIANRQDAQLEGLIGFFVNSLVLRLRVRPAQRFTDVLAEVRQTALEAYRYQDVPFERLVEELQPQRSVNAMPVFQVMFAQQNAPAVAQQLGGLEVERIHGHELRGRFDLEVHSFERDGRIRLLWVYNQSVFDEWRIDQMARHFVQVLRAVVAAPDQPVHSLVLVDPAETERLLERFNATS